MRLSKIEHLFRVFSSVLIILLSAGCNTKDKPQAPFPRHLMITDMAGRQVSVAVPVKKVILGFNRHLYTFAAVAGEDFPEKIAGWGKIDPISDQNIFKLKDKYPSLETIPDVGYHARGTFNVEKVIALKPDVVIFELGMFVNKNKYIGPVEDIDRLEKMGIKTVFIDYWKRPFKNTVPSTLLLGTLLGKEKRAKEIADFYQKRVDEVISRVEKINRSKPKVYLEGATKNPREYGWTCVNAGWGVIVNKAGGVNIAEGNVEESGATGGPIAPEYLLKTNPDVIIIAITGRSWTETPSSKEFRYHAESEESRQSFLKAVTERTGWNTLSAVKNGRVYGLFDSSYLIFNNIYNFTDIQAIAKCFHPDEFKDINPEADLREFNKKFLSIDYNDIWLKRI